MNQRIEMHKIREILRLYELGLSSRKISRHLNVSRPIISNYIQILLKHNCTYQSILTMHDDDIVNIIDNHNNIHKKEKYTYLSGKFSDYAIELKRTGVTLQILWKEYSKDVSSPYSYSQFCYHFQTWKNSKEISMHIEHKYGDKMFVDFTGKKLKVFNLQTNEEEDVEVFISILGASQLTYIEAVYTQKKEDFIRACENSLLYFDGVVQAIVPDCLKSAVTRGDKYEAEINPEFADFARHYNTVIYPARPYSPKDKALVENAVNIIYTRVFAPLRNVTFNNILDLNEAMHKLLEIHNNTKMQKLNYSRREDYERNERTKLKPLPIEKYSFKNFATSTVGVNYHVYLPEDKHYYSVPYRLKGRITLIIYVLDTIEVFYKNERVAIHKRERTQGKYSTNKDHMPSHHRFYADWSPENIQKWAAEIGNEVEEICLMILEIYKYPEQAFKSCIGIMSLGKKYGNDRLNKACELALEYNELGYKFIKNILENGMDKYEEEELSFTDIKHENLRGKEYYKNMENKHD